MISSLPAVPHWPRLSRKHASAAFLSAVVTLVPLTARTQESGSLTGVVTTTDRRPLGHAKISIVGTALVAVADTEGVFRLGSVPLGSQEVEVKLIGYASTHLPVTIASGKPSTLQIMLAPIAIPLDTVTVSGDTMTIPAIQGFLERRARGNGQFFTRNEIEHMHVRLFTDILRRVPGMQLQLITGTMNNNYTVRSGRNGDVQGTRQCPVLFYMNGMPFPTPNGSVINSFISPEDVTALEVYSGSSQIPAQFNASAYNARCGVIVIWTLNGTESRRGR